MNEQNKCKLCGANKSKTYGIPCSNFGGHDFGDGGFFKETHVIPPHDNKTEESWEATERKEFAFYMQDNTEYLSVGYNFKHIADYWLERISQIRQEAVQSKLEELEVEVKVMKEREHMFTRHTRSHNQALDSVLAIIRDKKK